MDIGIIILIVIGIFSIIGLAIFVYLIWREEEGGPSNPFGRPACTASTSSVPSLNGLPCCYQEGEVTPFRYLEQIDMVVGPSPVYYLDACSGFCENGNIASNNEECATGSSVQFQKCVSLTKPRNCRGSAMPIAALGTELFYALSATDEACPCDGACDGSTPCD